VDQHTDDDNVSKTDPHRKIRRNIANNIVNNKELKEMRGEIMREMTEMKNEVIEIVRNIEKKQRHLIEKLYDELTN